MILHLTKVVKSRGHVIRGVMGAKIQQKMFIEITFEIFYLES